MSRGRPTLTESRCAIIFSSCAGDPRHFRSAKPFDQADPGILKWLTCGDVGLPSYQVATPMPPDPALSDPRARELVKELARLEAELARVREAYRRAVEGPPGPRWYDSGTIHPELDDQVIVPPG